MPVVMTCPECQKADCDCGYFEPCPGCEKKVDPTAIHCPHCQFNLSTGQPASKPVPKSKPAPKRRGRPPATAKPVASPIDDYEGDEIPVEVVREDRRAAGRRLALVVALGRMGQPDPTWPQLKYRGDPENVTDDSLREWAQDFRAAYERNLDPSKSTWLANVALEHWCRVHSGDPVLKANSFRLLQAIGGNDRA